LASIVDDPVALGGLKPGQEWHHKYIIFLIFLIGMAE